MTTLPQLRGRRARSAPLDRVLQHRPPARRTRLPAARRVRRALRPLQPARSDTRRSTTPGGRQITEPPPDPGRFTTSPPRPPPTANHAPPSPPAQAASRSARCAPTRPAQRATSRAGAAKRGMLHPTTPFRSHTTCARTHHVVLAPCGRLVSEDRCDRSDKFPDRGERQRKRPCRRWGGALIWYPSM